MELGNQLLTPNHVLALDIEQRVSIKASRPVIKYAQATISYLQSWSNKNKKTNLHVCIQSGIYTAETKFKSKLCTFKQYTYFGYKILLSAAEFIML